MQLREPMFSIIKKELSKFNKLFSFFIFGGGGGGGEEELDFLG